MTTGVAVATAVTFIWLGMVLAISFLEAPLKFRAPEVTLRIGLGIGRLVFRALNIAEAVLATTLLVAIAVDGPSVRPALATAIVVLVVQLVFVRPKLTRRSNRVFAGEDPPRSRTHYAYIVLETAKVVALIVSGVLLLAL